MGDWSGLPGRSFKRSLAVWDAVGAWSSWGTENYQYTNLLVPGWTRQISCRNWSYKLMQIPNTCDKEVSQRSGKRHPVSELWQDEPKRGSCPRCLFVGCIKWNVCEWNCFTGKKTGTQKVEWAGLTCRDKGKRRMVLGQQVPPLLSTWCHLRQFASTPVQWDAVTG